MAGRAGNKCVRQSVPIKEVVPNTAAAPAASVLRTVQTIGEMFTAVEATPLTVLVKP